MRLSLTYNSLYTDTNLLPSFIYAIKPCPIRLITSPNILLHLTSHREPFFETVSVGNQNKKDKYIQLEDIHKYSPCTNKNEPRQPELTEVSWTINEKKKFDNANTSK